MLQISERFAAACSPIIDSTFDTSGSVTKASINHLSVTDLNDLFTPDGLFVDWEAWLFHSIEMMACGTRVYGFYDWIAANTDRTVYAAAYKAAVLGGSRVVGGPETLRPLIQGKQETIVNNEYWKMENSIKTAGGAYTVSQPATAIGTMTAGPLTDLTGGSAVIRVSNRHGIPLDPNWFREREVIYVFTNTAGVSQQGNWRVIDAAVDDSLTYIDVLVASENAGSSTPFFQLATDAASDKNGVILPGVNNVNDYERWCQNLPNTIGTKLVPFWYQTYRQTRSWDQEYEEFFKRLVTANAAFREFQNLDMAKRNAQDELQAKKRFVNAFLFQKAISANQTLALWESLEAINTVTEVDIKIGVGGKIQARRANFIGVKEQLRVCNRVKDLHGNPLNLLEFFDWNYAIMRARKSSGRTVTSIDWFTNNRYRDAFRDAMITYYKAKYQDTLRFIVEVGKENALGMIYDTYHVPFPGGIAINIVGDEFFDDWRDEHAAVDQEALGNLLLSLDIGKPGVGTIYYAMLASNRRNYKTADIQRLAEIDSTFRCVMETRYINQTLYSETGTVVVECPLHSTWIENIATAAPVTTGKTLPYDNLY